MLHYVRIAVTALGLTACVLLISLWVRSYRVYDDLCGKVGDGGALSIGSLRGRIILSHWPQLLDREWSWWQDEPDKDQIKSLSNIDHAIGFNTYTTPEGAGVLVPHWFLVSLTAIVGILAWPRGSYRFSLCTLLIATTLVAVALGIVIAFSQAGFFVRGAVGWGSHSPWQSICVRTNASLL